MSQMGQSERDALKFRCPLYPQQRTFLDAVPMSDKGHKQTLRGAANVSSREFV